MNNLLEWLAKFFDHIPVQGIEALLIQGIKAAIVLLTASVTLRILLKGIDCHFTPVNKSDEAAIRFYKRISRYFIWSCGILIALHVVGIELSSLFTTRGLVAVALGFALKSIAENYFAGLIIKTDETIKHGDVLEVDGLMVKVKSIGVRSTIVRTKDASDILIPNSMFTQNKVGNYTLRDSLCRVWTTVGVSYSSDLKQVRNVLEKVCASFEGRSIQQTPVVLLDGFGDSSVNYRMFIWTEDPWNTILIKSRLNEAIWWALKEADIEIAFPQMDVHFDKSAASRLSDNQG